MAATITTKQGTFATNTYAAPCRQCGAVVAAGTGSILKVLGKWETAHAGCEQSMYNVYPIAEPW